MHAYLFRFKVLYGQRLRTSPLFKQHAGVELAPIVEPLPRVHRALIMPCAPSGPPAPKEVAPGGNKQQDTECAAGGLRFYTDNLGPTDDDTAASEQLLLHYAEIYGTDQQQTAVEELADNNTDVETAANETAAKEPCAASASGKGSAARRTGSSYMAKRPGGKRFFLQKPPLPAGGGAAQASATPVKERHDVQELLKSAFKRNVSSMSSMIEQQNNYLLDQRALDPSTAIFTQAAMEIQMSPHGDEGDLFQHDEF